MNVDAALDQEQREREAAERRDVDLNFPVDVPRPTSMIPVGFGVDGNARPAEFHTESVVMEPREVGEIGGRETYLDYLMGGPDFAGRSDGETKQWLRDQWQEHMDGECPDFDDSQTGEIEIEMAKAALEREILEKMAREEEPEVFEIKGRGELVDVQVDLSGIMNQDLKAALTRVGGEKYIQEIMRTAVRMRLMAPRSEKYAWTIKLEDPKDRFLMASLNDFARMFVVSEGDEKKPIELPDPGDGTSTADLKDLVLAIHRLRLNGDSLQKHVGLEVESLG